MFLMLIIILTNIDFTESQEDISRGIKIVPWEIDPFCDVPANRLMDGDLQTIEQFNCPHNTFAAIFVNTTEHVKYMIFYTGDSGSHHGEHWLDALLIQCAVAGLMYSCAKFPAPISMIRNLRNGAHVTLMGQTDVVYLKGAIGNLSEIELYGRDEVTHRGCFSYVSGSDFFSFGGFGKCQTDCEPNPFGISQPRSSCVCLDEIDFESEVSLSECDATCDDSNNKCGGNNVYSVYIQEYSPPVFAGCHVGTNHLTESNINFRSLTFSKCVRLCGDRVSYFWKGKCGCADSPNGLVTDGTSEHYHIVQHGAAFCHTRCDFDDENACGGLYAISIYRTCATTKLVLCDELLKCKRAIFDHHGVCTHGCKSGFEGRHCIKRVSDSLPGEEPDEELDVIGMTLTTRPRRTRTGIITTGTSPDIQRSIDRITSSDTLDDSTNLDYNNYSISNITTRKSKSVRVITDYIFSIWVAATYLSLLF